MRTKVHTTTATLKFLNIKCTHRLFRWKRPTALLKHQPMIKSNDNLFFFCFMVCLSSILVDMWCVCHSLQPRVWVYGFAGISHLKYVQLDCIGCFILFKRVTGWHGLFPSWEGLGVGSLIVKSQWISHEVTDLPTPKSPPKRGLSNLMYRNFNVSM